MQPTAGGVQRAVWRSAEIGVILLRMKTNRKTALLLAALVVLSSAALLNSATPPGSGPEYTSDGQMKLPENYRQWVYLTTGFDMSYNKAAMQMDHHMFDNVFVNPEAYAAFQQTGTWPDKTVLVLEGRRAEGKGSINQKGSFQTSDMMGIEAHVKDEARFPGKWAFFAFGDGKTAKMIPTNMECYSCHADHAAVDTTFVQFYPTLLPIAQSKGTLGASYQKESSQQK
jgi:Cytochrome P460